MTVTVSFWRDEDNRVKTFIYQDSPQFRNDGAYADFAHHEVLELLNRLESNQQDSEHLLRLVLQQPGSNSSGPDLRVRSAGMPARVS
jgi:hypothetical protein